MNKLWTVLALTITSHYSFAAAEKIVTKDLPAEGKPAVVLQVFDESEKIAKPIKEISSLLAKNKQGFAGTVLIFLYKIKLLLQKLSMPLLQ